MVKRALNQAPETTSKRQLEDEGQNNQTKTKGQNSISSFFGAPKVTARGAAESNVFPQDFSIFNWNVNGCSAGIQKGTLIEFINEFDPTILCLNETKID